MKTWLFKLLRDLTGATEEIASVRHQLADERALCSRQMEAVIDLQRQRTTAEAQIRLLEAQKATADTSATAAQTRALEAERLMTVTRGHLSAAEQHVKILTAHHDEDVKKIRSQTLALSCAETRAEQAEARLALASHYLSDIPPPSLEEVKWEADDAKALTHFLEVSPAGKKLAQHLANRLADYERAAVLFRHPNEVQALLKRAHGFRDCRGEIRRLSAAGPSPATSEPQAFPLPDELENLRG